MNIKKPQPDDTFVGDRTFAVAGTDEVYTEYGDAPQVTDKGPWTPSDDGRHIQSEDFEHDVTLRVSGDFATDEDRIAYTKWLAAKLNATPQVPDGMVLVSPEGEVIGPCVCGGWPGGKCLRCKVVSNDRGERP